MSAQRGSTRRQWLIAGAGAALASPAIGALAAQATYKAIAFDGFPIFDLRPVAAKTEALFPGRGALLTSTWRTRQFEYQWLRALSGDYADFLQTTRDGLVYAARALGLELTAAARDELMALWENLGVWPDVPMALKALRASGLRLCIVSNMTQRMLDDGLERAGLTGALDHVLSTDRIRTYKPSPQAYGLGTKALGLAARDILFVPFAGWDAAGAKAYGHPVYWLNRLQAPREEWAAAPDGSGREMQDLLAYVAMPGT